MRKVLAVAVSVMLLVGSVACAGVKEANELFNKKDFSGALAEYQKVLPELTGEEAISAQYYIGSCLLRLKKYSEAMTEYRKVLDAESTSMWIKTRAQFNTCGCLEAQKKYDEAITEYKKLLTIDGISKSETSNINYHIGICNERIGQRDEAQKYFVAGCQDGVASNVFKLNFDRVKDVSVVTGGIIAQLRKSQKQEDVEFILKRVSENPTIARQVVLEVANKPYVVSYLKPFCNLSELSIKEQAQFYLTLWKANLASVIDNPDAKVIVDGAVTAIVQLLPGVGENPSISQVEKILLEMK